MRRRYRSGQLALREIKKYQGKAESRETIVLIPTGTFLKLVRDELGERSANYRMSESALFALHIFVEDHTIRRLRQAYGISRHAAKRQTLFPVDLELAEGIGTGHLDGVPL